MDGSVVIQRPLRWDSPFSPDMTDEDVDRVLALEAFRDMDEDSFPPNNSLRDIVRYDMRFVRHRDGDIVVRKGDYGNSMFLILRGGVRVVVNPDLPPEVLGRQQTVRRGFVASLKQLWNNPREPEVRDRAALRKGVGIGQRGAGGEAHVFLQDVPAILNNHHTELMPAGTIFGEVAALGRMPRTLSLFAEGDTELLEIRWQGIRDIRRRDDAFRQHVDKLYRERSLMHHLRALPMFRHLDSEQLQKVADQTLFETYGEFEWHTSFKKLASLSAEEKLRQEPVIAEECDYVDGLILMRSGFARVSRKINNGHPTVSFVGRGETFGFEELVHNWRNGAQEPYQHSLRGLGNVDILRVPTQVMEEIVLPTMPSSEMPPPLEILEHGHVSIQSIGEASPLDGGLMEFLVENRVVNGRATMMINTDRCVRCDDCVRACAATHNNNPRFVRHGKRHENVMIANACMHCNDPVCMIGCPTGAIHRSSLEGQVVINDASCIGCATCANSCPYDNIRMVAIRDEAGEFIRDEANQPILKSTKCDLCVDQMGGPACERACPHDALRRVNLNDLGSIADWLNKP
jgi:Fe-S-cluster-containing dehydrogenase component/CRP-like cAMP-binding protein